MSDRYIDQFETLAYGPFAADQIEALVLPIDPGVSGVSDEAPPPAPGELASAPPAG